MTRVLATLTARLRRIPAAARTATGLVGAALVVAGCLGPWSTFPGFPGKMMNSGHPGGARLYVLVLAASAALLFLDRLRRRRAGLLAVAGALAITGGNAFAISGEGSGPASVAWGAWVAGAGAVLLGAAFLALPDDPPPPRFGRAPLPLELLAIAAALGLVLVTTVRGLAVVESSRFLSFLAVVASLAAVADALGGLAWLQRTIERHRAFSAACALVAACAFPLTQGGSGYWVRVFASIGVFAAAALGLNVVVGLAGLLDLGYIAFFGVGAYVGALLGGAALTTVDVNLPFLLVVFIGAVIAAIFGVFIGAPTLRLRGDYLAIVTLGFGEIFRIAANNWDGLTRGPNGISGVPDLELLGFDFGESHEVGGILLAGFANYYYLEILLVVAGIVAFTRLNDSRVGRAWVAIREDETAAAAMGINTIRLKLLAFAIGAFLAGAAGTVNAHVTSQVSPDSYTFLESILLLAAVVLGGMGTVGGALLGSTALFVIPEKLRAFQDKRLLLFGIALIVLMRFRPEGIVASRRRQRELHDDTAAGDAMTGPTAGVGAGADAR